MPATGQTVTSTRCASAGSSRSSRRQQPRQAHARPGSADRMTSCAQSSPASRAARMYSQRQWMVEPVFGQIKANRRIARFTRRRLAAARSGWWLITATHNLLKLHRHTRQAARPKKRPRPGDLGLPEPPTPITHAFARQPPMDAGATSEPVGNVACRAERHSVHAPELNSRT